MNLVVSSGPAEEKPKSYQITVPVDTSGRLNVSMTDDKQTDALVDSVNVEEGTTYSSYFDYYGSATFIVTIDGHEVGRFTAN